MTTQAYPLIDQAADFVGDDNTKAGDYIKGLIVIFDVSAVPGVDTVQCIVEGKDTTSGIYYTILASTLRAAIGTEHMHVYPGLLVAANVSKNDVIPDQYRVRVAHSGTGLFNYTIGVYEVG